MCPTARELLDEVKRGIREISPEELQLSLGAGVPLRLLDVREADELAAGRLPGAVHIPRGQLEMQVEAVAQRHEPLVLYCAGGNRSALAARSLSEMGYADVRSLAGGFDRWHDQGRPVEKAEGLSSEQRERYRRHLAIPEVGEAGQARLLDAKVLILGAGGLGSPAALYLAAAGVGTLGIVDDDTVELSNLQRQVIHAHSRLGMAKAESAAQGILEINPGIDVKPFPMRFTAANARSILDGFDVVIDGGDNFPTRYLLNDACVLLGKPNVHGSIYRFEGQVTTFWPGADRRSPCYRCLFPSPPPADLAPSCAEAGVLGVVPGLVGVLQASEALKIILKQGAPLIGRMLVVDALGTRFEEMAIAPDPRCPVCRPGATITLSDLPDACPSQPARLSP